MQVSSENIRCVFGMQDVSSFTQNRKKNKLFQIPLLNNYAAIYDLEIKK